MKIKAYRYLSYFSCRKLQSHHDDQTNKPKARMTAKKKIKKKQTIRIKVYSNVTRRYSSVPYLYLSRILSQNVFDTKCKVKGAHVFK